MNMTKLSSMLAVAAFVAAPAVAADTANITVSYEVAPAATLATAAHSIEIDVTSHNLNSDNPSGSSSVKFSSNVSAKLTVKSTNAGLQGTTTDAAGNFEKIAYTVSNGTDTVNSDTLNTTPFVAGTRLASATGDTVVDLNFAVIGTSSNPGTYSDTLILSVETEI